jgi:hypothetical protein
MFTLKELVAEVVDDLVADEGQPTHDRDGLVWFHIKLDGTCEDYD